MDTRLGSKGQTGRARTWAIAALTLVGSALGAACSGSSGGTQLDCIQGNAACLCYGNQTCNGGLACVSGICSAPQSSGNDPDSGISPVGTGSSGSSSGAAGSSSGNAPSSSSSGASAGSSSSSGAGSSSSGSSSSGVSTGGGSSSGSASSSSSSGVAGSSSSGGGVGSSSSSSGGITCQAPAESSAIVTASDGYLSSATLADGGFTWAAADGNGSTACANTGTFCGTGITGIGDPYGTVWGAQIGLNLNQADNPTATANPYPVPPTSIGIFYQVNRIPLQGLRIITDVNGVDYCAVLHSASALVLWTSFNTQCWSPAFGSYLQGPPPTSHKIAFDVPAVGGGPSEAFSLCVDALFYE